MILLNRCDAVPTSVERANPKIAPMRYRLSSCTNRGASIRSDCSAVICGLCLAIKVQESPGQGPSFLRCNDVQRQRPQAETFDQERRPAHPDLAAAGALRTRRPRQPAATSGWPGRCAQDRFLAIQRQVVGVLGRQHGHDSNDRTFSDPCSSSNRKNPSQSVPMCAEVLRHGSSEGCPSSIAVGLIIQIVMNSSAPIFRSIGRRLAYALGGTLSIALAGAAYGAWALDQSADKLAHLVGESIATERLVADWHLNVAAGIRRTMAVAVSSDPTLADFFKDEAAATSKSSRALQEQVAKLMVGPKEKAVFEEISVARTAYNADRDAVFLLKKSGDFVGARKAFDERYMPASAKYQDALRRMASLERQAIDDASVSVQAASRSARIALLAFGIGSVLLGGILSWWLVRSITRPIERAVSVADRIAKLDLTDKVEGHDRDETGRLLQALALMQRALSGLVTQVRSSTDGIGIASAEIADGNMDLSSRTEQAAANLQQTAASIEQMNSAVQQSAISARAASDLACTAANVAMRGGEVVARVVCTMEEINESSRQISDIIGVIDGIAFQTNILALNAAVEAARAGEQGRGFAVVASEVRSLAQRSANAAKEIKGLIGSSVGKVEVGTLLVAEAGRTMNEVVDSARRVSTIISEITVAANDQSRGIGEVNKSVAQLDNVTQQNAALVEESAAAATSLRDQARKLAEIVQQFRLAN